MVNKRAIAPTALIDSFDCQTGVLKVKVEITADSWLDRIYFHLSYYTGYVHDQEEPQTIYYHQVMQKLVYNGTGTSYMYTIQTPWMGVSQEVVLAVWAIGVTSSAQVSKDCRS